MNLKDTLKGIEDVYLSDDRPWVLGFSGGKDSTCTLQLVWRALSTLPARKLTKPIHVLSSNTLVESPAIVSYIRRSLANIQDSAASTGLPITAQIVEPMIEESFWVNLIGRGYPAPYSKFRWCTWRLKISPANRFIKDQVARFGEVVLVLGVRTSESATRAQVMALHRIEGSALRTHTTLPGALVYAPIADWTTDDVWSFLLQNAQTPWNTDNNDLAAMYRTADGECPLVVDTTTPSCGNSRFGCWVCTVVTRDNSMQAMVDAGHTWMEDLLEIRDFLAATQEEPRKSEVRTIRKIDGRILLKDAGDEAALGPYKLEFCKEVLNKVLSVQEKLPPEAQGMRLISDEELFEIRRLWCEERHDWDDSLPKIYEKCTGKKWLTIAGVRERLVDETAIINKVADANGIPALLMKKLIDAERQTLGMKRRAGIYERLKAIIDEDWRTDLEVEKDIAALKRLKR